MRYKPLDLIGGFGKDAALAWNVEDTVNYIPEKAGSAGARTPTKLRRAPGLKPSVEIAPGGPAIRGAHNAEGKLFIVAGNRFYQITNAGIAIHIGTVPGVQRVEMAHNQITGGNEILIATGTPNGYIYNTVTQVFGKIVDPGYPGTGSVDYVDSYLVQVEPFGRFWFWSDLAAAGDYNTLDRAEAEASPDKIVGLAVNNFEVVIFGQRTLEFFYNAGSATGTFQSKRIWIEVGCASRFTIAKMDNTLYWLSPERILYRLNGYQAEPVSTPQFEEAIASYNLTGAFAFVYESQGHKIYYLTFPDGQTFGFDVTTGLMHRRESYGLNRWRLNTLTAWNGKWIGGDFQQARLYEMDWAYMLESESDPLVSERASGVLAAAQNSITIPYIELILDSGHPETVPVMFETQPEGPLITGDAPDWGVDELYTPYPYTLSNGTPPYTVSLLTGTLPPGLALSTAGIITGTPTTVGTYPFTVRNRDSNLLFDDLDDSIRILSPWFSITNGGTLKSPDGIDWVGMVDVALTGQYVFSGNGVVLALDGFIGTAGASSANIGATWTPLTGVGAATLTSGCYTGTHYIIGGTASDVWRSANGIAFSTVALPSNLIASGALSALTTGVVLCGGEAAIGGNICVSTDHGATFGGETDAFTGLGTQDVNDICNNGTTFLIVGDSDVPAGKLSKTTNGSSFTQISNPLTTPASSIVCCACGEHNNADRWVIANAAGQIAHSSNLVAWTMSATNFGTSPAKVHYADGRFIMVGGTSMKSSVDGGATWQAITHNNSGNLESITAYVP